ncbi:hypothetical protein SNOUR_42000 [Streptomyces noursei ATCC 11455]|nr:hypothetical protein SNOUR_42000 [Streptomyces noursei ATCC 11455]
MARPLAPALLEDFVQVRGLPRENVDAFMKVAVAGGLRDPSIHRGAVHTPLLPEPAQYQHRLAERAQ